MIKKYFKEEKVQKGEVINTKSGHQIRASVEISLVMLCLFYFSHQTSVIMEKMFMPSGGFLICINFHDPPSQLTALTEEDLKHRLITVDELSWTEGNQSEPFWTRLDCHTEAEGVLMAFTQHIHQQGSDL